MAGVTLRNAANQVVGSAVLLQDSDGVRIILDVKDMTPGAKAVHIHSVGRCDRPSFETAGPHFNPRKAQHGSGNTKGPHAGDLPDIVIEDNGQGHLEVTNPLVSLESGTSTTLFTADGTSLVVHEKPDDMRTDPAGNSGARVACGVIVRGG